MKLMVRVCLKMGIPRNCDFSGSDGDDDDDADGDGDGDQPSNLWLPNFKSFNMFR
jgi:hypothetical protein